MRKALTLLATLAALTLAGSASTKTLTVTITKAGFTPSRVTIAVGDSVTWVNQDTGQHQVVSQDVPFTSPVLAPGQSFTFTFAKAGRFAYQDALAKKNVRGTVEVTAAAVTTVTVAAAPTLLAYGARTTLSGVVSTQAAGEQVAVLARPCGATTSTKVVMVATTTGGAWTAVVQPLKKTAYSAQVKTATSPVVTVLVKPRLTLRRLAPKRFGLAVRASSSLSGRAVVLQRYNATLGRWVAVRTALLVRGPLATAPTVLSKATFAATVRAGTRLRASLSQLQAGSCYRAALSNVLRT